MVTTASISDGEKFFCPSCKLHIALCKCPEYVDQGCWDCGPDCKIDQRRKLKEECLKTLLKQLNPH